MWYDMADTSTLTINSGFVEGVQDKSGNGIHLLASGTLRPAYSPGGCINGIITPQFDGLNDMLQSTATFTMPQPFTVIAVARPTQGGIESIVGCSNQTWMLFNAGPLYISSGAQLQTGSQRVLGQANYAVGIFDSTNSMARMHGVIGGVGNVGTFSWSGVTSVGRFSGGQYPFRGMIGEILLYSGRLDLSQIARIESYLTQKWGLGEYPVSPGGVGSGLAVWLDASDTDTIVLDGSNNVIELRDKSGNGRHVTSATAGLPPTLTTSTPNNLTAINFTNQQLDHPTAQTYTVGTVAVAWEHPGASAAVYEGICGYRTGGTIVSSLDMELILPQQNRTSRVWGLTNMSSPRFILNGVERSTSENEPVNASPAKTSPNRWNVGILTSVPSSGLKRLILGADAYVQTSRRVQNCRIGEVIVYDRALSDTEITSLTAYLTNKWGATP